MAEKGRSLHYTLLRLHFLDSRLNEKKDNKISCDNRNHSRS